MLALLLAIACTPEPPEAPPGGIRSDGLVLTATAISGPRPPPAWATDVALEPPPHAAEAACAGLAGWEARRDHALRTAPDQLWLSLPCAEVPSPPADPLADLRATARDPRADLQALVRDHPSHATAIERALRSCALEPASDAAARCLSALAVADRAGAVDVAGELPPAEPRLDVVVRTLTRFPDADGLPRALRKRGALPEGPTAGVTAVELLASVGRASALPDEPGRQLWRLAALAELDAVFEVRRPAPGGAHTALFAWADDRRFRVLAPPEGGTEHGLGLINAILEHGASERRVGWIDDVAVAAPIDALEWLVEQELVSTPP